MGKGLKEFQLYDSRRLRKKPQDAQDDVTELFDLFDAHFWGWKGIQNLDSQRRSSPVQHVDVCVILPAFCGFMVSGKLLKQLGAFRASCRNPKKQDCHTLQRVDLARPFLVSPAIKIEIENSLEMALSEAKSGSAWQSHFWQCGTLRPARNTKLFKYITQVKQSWVLFKQQAFNATGEDHFLESKKPMCLRPRK